MKSVTIAKKKYLIEKTKSHKIKITIKAGFQKDTKDTRPLTCAQHDSFIIITKLFNKHKMSGLLLKLTFPTLVIYGAPQYLRQFTSVADKDFGPPLWTTCAFLLPDYLLWDVVPSLSLALVFGTLFLPTSLQHLLYSLSENV